jgi:hypothetical protein
LGNELGQEPVQKIQPPKQIPNAEYIELTRSLNVQQRRYFLHTSQNLKSGKCFQEFVSGGAGTGEVSSSKLSTKQLFDFIHQDKALILIS